MFPSVKCPPLGLNVSPHVPSMWQLHKKSVEAIFEYLDLDIQKYKFIAHVGSLNMVGRYPINPVLHRFIVAKSTEPWGSN